MVAPVQPKAPKEQPREQLQLLLDAPATPDRVVAVANMFADAARAAGADASTVTMEVHNWATDATLRGWGEEGARQVNDIIWVLREPTLAIAQAPQLRGVAQAFAKHGKALAKSGGRFRHKGARGRKGDLGVLDDRFVDVMERVGKDDTVPVQRVGTTELHTPVLRVGRVQVDQPLKVRIIAGGKACEVSFDGPEAARRVLADAAIEEHWCRVQISARWVLEDGAHRLDPTSIVVRDATRWTPLSGAASLTQIGTLSAATSALLLDQLIDEE